MHFPSYQSVKALESRKLNLAPLRVSVCVFAFVCVCVCVCLGVHALRNAWVCTYLSKKYSQQQHRTTCMCVHTCMLCPCLCVYVCARSCAHVFVGACWCVWCDDRVCEGPGRVVKREHTAGTGNSGLSSCSHC